MKHAILTSFALGVALNPWLCASAADGEPVPILVTAMVHVDPLPTTPDVSRVLAAYEQHRDGWLWYLELAERSGLCLSAQMTGVYAEACVRQGHASDFASCMPGGPHHLGTHLHANVKAQGPYVWETRPTTEYHHPETVARVFADNLPWVNAVFEANRFTAADNWLFHGSHASYFGMDQELFGDPELPYSNRFSMVGAVRGGHYLYRGPWLQEPSQATGDYLKVAEVGGIIGQDALHGPEGMVYGTLPYQRRDFLMAYIEWREMVRRGDRGPIRHFTWMVHPCQLTTGFRGTDGRTTRKTINELVQWLQANFVDRSDDTGQVVARFANAAKLRDELEAWEQRCPAEASDLQHRMEHGDPPRYLPAILDRLTTTFHVGEVLTAPAEVTVHRFCDHDSGASLFLSWTHDGQIVDLDEVLQGRFRVYHGNGHVEDRSASEIVLSSEPVLLEDLGSPAPRLPSGRVAAGTHSASR